LSVVDLTTFQWIALLGSGLLVGIHKTGLNGLAMIVIPIMAAAFGARASIGITLPMLIVGDIIAVIYYRQHAQLKVVVQALPWVMLGVGIGAFVGDAVSNATFERLIGISLIIGLGFTAYQEFSRREIVVPRTWLIAALIGSAAGFSSMIGNAAILMSLYFLALGFKKNQIIGTIAWLFVTVNVSKVFIHRFMWHTISLDTLRLNLVALPAILVGALLGFILVRLIPERPYRFFLMAAVGVAAIRLAI
jgi:uncharacterized protein